MAPVIAGILDDSDAQSKHALFQLLDLRFLLLVVLGKGAKREKQLLQEKWASPLISHPFVTADVQNFYGRNGQNFYSAQRCSCTRRPG
eukprot:2865216-Rhodomonas_salina.1